MTLLDIVTRAIRMTGARALGDEPSAEETAAALTAMQGMVLTLLPGTHLTDVYVTADYTAGENERITANSALSVTISVPDVVTDSKTGATRAPLNGARVLIANGPQYVYVAETQTWNRLDALALTDDQPFGAEHDEGLAAMLAVRIGPDLQLPNVPQWVVQMAQDGRKAIRQRFRQPFHATTDPLLLNVFQRCGSAL